MQHGHMLAVDRVLVLVEEAGNVVLHGIRVVLDDEGDVGETWLGKVRACRELGVQLVHPALVTSFGHLQCAPPTRQRMEPVSQRRAV